MRPLQPAFLLGLLLSQGVHEPPGVACTEYGRSQLKAQRIARMQYHPMSPRHPKPSRSFATRMSPFRKSSDPVQSSVQLEGTCLTMVGPAAMPA